MVACELTWSSEAAAEEELLADPEAAPTDTVCDAKTQGARAGNNFAGVHGRVTDTAPVKRLPRRVRHVACGLSAAVGLVVLATVVCSRGPWQAKASVTSPGAVRRSAVGLSVVDSMLSILSTMKDGVDAMDNLATTVNGTFHNFTDMVNNMSDMMDGLTNTSAELYDKMNAPSKWRTMIKSKIQGMNATQKADFKANLKKKLGITSWKQLRPAANLTDGNPCPDDEELYAGLCYTRCSNLTQGGYPFRASAWTCCSHEPPCDDKGSTRVEVCEGYDTSHAADGCPHAPGSCLLDEELFGGFCYKKCALITFGVLPYRGGAGSCCNSDDKLALMNLEGCDTDAQEYAIGGGNGYSATEPLEPHQPIPELTEATS